MTDITTLLHRSPKTELHASGCHINRFVVRTRTANSRPLESSSQPVVLKKSTMVLIADRRSGFWVAGPSFTDKRVLSPLSAYAESSMKRRERLENPSSITLCYFTSSPFVLEPPFFCTTLPSPGFFAFSALFAASGSPACFFACLVRFGRGTSKGASGGGKPWNCSHRSVRSSVGTNSQRASTSAGGIWLPSSSFHSARTAGLEQMVTTSS